MLFRCSDIRILRVAGAARRGLRHDDAALLGVDARVELRVLNELDDPELGLGRARAGEREKRWRQRRRRRQHGISTSDASASASS